MVENTVAVWYTDLRLSGGGGVSKKYSRAYVEITNICNMSCSFCHGHSRETRRMTGEEFSLVLDKLDGVTDYVYYHLMGEPLTHPQLAEFISTASARGFKSIITTNGTLLDRCGDKILSAGLHKVSISVHSFEDGSDVDFKEYMKTISDFARKANEKGVIIVFRLWNNGADSTKNDEVLSFLQEYFADEWAENSKGYRIKNKMFLEWGDRFTWPDKNADFQGDDVFCYGLRDHFGILCDGTVVPCCLDSDGVISLGNIFTDSIENILSSDRARAMVKGFDCRRATEELCRRCSYAQRFAK